VHEAYLRISCQKEDGWEGRRHFFFAAARAMRDILIEQARKKQSLKRGGDRARVEIQDIALAMETPGEEVLALDEALQQLEEEDPEGHAIVTLRYYGGLTMREIAEFQGVTTRTIERKWRFLRAWLADEIRR
jgi:RNA polymerase sigma factor (TIGR02999 family)